MGELAYVDHRKDPAAWAAALGISREAVELYLASEVIDLHVDSFIWTRILGYDLSERHGGGLLGGRFYSQLDFPRLREAQLGGAMWSITTSPFRSAEGRAKAFAKNMQRIKALFAEHEAHFAIVKTRREYDLARAAGKHAVMLVVQGGNAIDRDFSALDMLADDSLVRVTLLHLSSSRLGTTSFPLHVRSDEGLSTFGKTYVEALDAHRVFVDLAHIGRKSFFDAVAMHDKSLPLICTHTGVSAVTPSWRNLDDEQIRAIAETGGTIGVIFHGAYVGGSIEGIVRHVEHVVRTVGPDHVSIGSDFDGAIIPPKGLRSCLELPRLCDAMLRAGLSPEVVQKALGGNFLRTFQALRG